MLINPELPEHFFNLDIDERQAAELKEFWEVPFIMTDEYNPDDYANYLYRTEFVGIKAILTEAEFNAKVEDERQSWFKVFPTGIAYRVHCLDGGAWDRPTNWGSFGTLEEAKACCVNGPSWRTKAISSAADG